MLATNRDRNNVIKRGFIVTVVANRQNHSLTAQLALPLVASEKNTRVNHASTN
jgi:hypothetical protein